MLSFLIGWVVVVFVFVHSTSSPHWALRVNCYIAVASALGSSVLLLRGPTVCAFWESGASLFVVCGGSTGSVLRRGTSVPGAVL